MTNPNYRVSNNLDCQLVLVEPSTGLYEFVDPHGITRYVPRADFNTFCQEQTEDDPLGLIGCDLEFHLGSPPVRVVDYRPHTFEYLCHDVHSSTRFKWDVSTLRLQYFEKARIREVRRTVAKAAPVVEPPCHVESVNKNRGQDVPDVVRAAVLDRGERAVRRTLRSWPFDKALKHRVVETATTFTVEWFWEATA
jgi:hypothetical protein